MNKNQKDQTVSSGKKGYRKAKMDLLMPLVFAICYHADQWILLQNN